jgi:hypothetical protein
MLYLILLISGIGVAVLCYSIEVLNQEGIGILQD